MITAEAKGLKIVLKLAKGSQTVSGCHNEATDEQLYNLGAAVGRLTEQSVEMINKVEETTLISE